MGKIMNYSDLLTNKKGRKKEIDRDNELQRRENNKSNIKVICMEIEQKNRDLDNPFSAGNISYQIWRLIIDCKNYGAIIKFNDLEMDLYITLGKKLPPINVAFPHKYYIHDREYKEKGNGYCYCIERWFERDRKITILYDDFTYTTRRNKKTSWYNVFSRIM